jgi:hypothetical protein
MASDRVVRFSTRAFPGRNMWWLVLELENGVKEEVYVTSGADLEALCNIIRRAHEVTFNVDGGIIITSPETLTGGQ